MKVNPLSIITIVGIYIFACFQIEKALEYDVFYSPDYNIVLKTILFVAIHSLFAYVLSDIYSDSLTRKKVLRNIILLAFGSWFLYKAPQLVDYTSRARFQRQGLIQLPVLIEWLEIIVIPIIITRIYDSRKGFLGKSKDA